MNKVIVIFFLSAFSLMLNAQAKKPVPVKKTQKGVPTASATAVDTVTPIEVEPAIPQEFAVYSKRYKVKKPRISLCLNLIGGDSIFNYCMPDSLVRDPEKIKLLFQKQEGDSLYALVYVSAFTKDPERPECSGGRETKLYFVRWNAHTNKAIVKQKFIESCYRTITRISDESIIDWDGVSILTMSYNRGQKFIDLKFDPANFKLGLQSLKDTGDK